MLKNYLKIAYRNLVRYKAYALTNIFGLAVGLAATILILLYIRFEFSYDDFHANKERLYRISVIRKKEGQVQSDSPVFTAPLGQAMAREFPEVENFARISTPRVAYLSFEEHAHKITGILHADSTFFDLFSFNLLAGNPKQALREPYSIVLTEATARRIFGEVDPLGQMVKLDNQDSYRITGIVETPPSNSHIQFDLLISFSTLYKDPNLFMDWNGGNQYIAYVLLAPNISPDALEQKFPDFMWSHINEQLANYGLSLEPYLQPLADIHLYYDEHSDSVRANLWIFAAVALLILFIACVNFVNLTTARATKRGKEVGVRKVLGANRLNLIRQFLSESILLSLMAFVLALLFVELSLPLFENLLSRELSVGWSADVANIAVLFGIIFVVGMLAGCYPAFYLSSFEAAKTLKGILRSGDSGRQVRSGSVLIVLQFAISIVLIICTLVVSSQLSFLKSKDPGYNKENIVVLPLIGDDVQLQSETLKRELRSVPGVLGVTASSEVPYDGFTSNGYIPEGYKNPLMIHVVDVDESFLETFDIQLVQGRQFDQEFGTDKTAYLINETLAKLLNWTEPVGKTIRRNGEHQVIGVVKDFHFATLHDRIAPLIITHQPWRDRFTNLSVRISGGHIPGTLTAIRNTWQQVAPSTPFEYWFLDAAFDRLYKSEQTFRQIFVYFSSLAIFLALLGLLSLASFSAEQRTKEIGIRKVLGATTVSVVTLLSGRFMKYVAVSNLLAWPVAYIAMRHWLQDFAYRIELGWWLFALAGAVALMVALVTVGTQAIRASLANPVQSLRYE